MKDHGALLRAGMEELEIPVTDDQVGAFLMYLAELKKWTRAYNLTAIRGEREIITRHFLDSLLFLKVLPPEAESTADVGSGAGFPGIPLKIVRPGLRVFLIEPTQKKAAFLRHVCARLGLAGIEVIDRRLEDVTGLTVDAAMTRALFSVGDFVKKAKGILNPGGVLLLSKGPKAQEEMKGLEGLDMSIEDLTLPFENLVRRLIVVRFS